MQDLPDHIKVYDEGLIGKEHAAKHRKSYRMDELDKCAQGQVIVQFGPDTMVTETFLDAFFMPSLKAGQDIGFSKRAGGNFLVQCEFGFYQIVRHSNQTDRQFGEIWHDLTNLKIKHQSETYRAKQDNLAPRLGS